MADYRRRIVDNELDELMPGVAAIAIEGARAVGKTETATARAATSFRLDQPAVRAVLEADPERIVTAPRPVLVDEWQLMRETWDVVRRAVDADPVGGQFLLTGSASPANPPTHTGAGRIISLRMRPMTLAERGVGVPSVSLADLLTGRKPTLDGETTVAAEQYAHEIVASGLPGLRDLPERAIRAQLDGYIERIVDTDVRDLGGLAIRNHAALRRWIAAYACAISSTTSYEKIRDASTAGHAEKPTKVTVLHWLDTLERLWVIEPLPAWSPQRNDLSRLIQSPKHQLVDPALAGRLRGVVASALLDGTEVGPLGPRAGTLFGALFESLVTLIVRVYAQAAEARVGHFRTQNGDREVDLVVERADRRVVAVEVKLAQTIGDEDVKHLLWLRDRIGADLLDAIVVSTGPYAYRRPDGIGVVPAALLGP
jgi:predicted AAA+ superfamily ATPase